MAAIAVGRNVDGGATASRTAGRMAVRQEDEGAQTIDEQHNEDQVEIQPEEQEGAATADGGARGSGLHRPVSNEHSGTNVRAAYARTGTRQHGPYGVGLKLRNDNARLSRLHRLGQS